MTTPTPTPHSAEEILTALVLCGLMGTMGQGIRAVLGLKNSSATANQTGQAAEFNAAYFGLSLMIGFIAGMLAGMLLDLNNFMSINTGDPKLLLGVVASGYAGADFIENSMSLVLPNATAAGGKPATSAPTGTPDDALG